MESDARLLPLVEKVACGLRLITESMERDTLSARRTVQDWQDRINGFAAELSDGAKALSTHSEEDVERVVNDAFPIDELEFNRDRAVHLCKRAIEALNLSKPVGPMLTKEEEEELVERINANPNLRPDKPVGEGE